MAWRPHGRAHVNPSHPRAWGICDDCGFLYDHSRLRWKYQWAGPQLQNLRFLVCEKCWDVPQPQLKPRILPPDPMPVLNARPPDYELADVDWFLTNDNEVLITQDGDDMIEQNSSNYRGNDPLPVPFPPIIDTSYIATQGGIGNLLLVTEDGSLLVTE